MSLNYRTPGRLKYASEHPGAQIGNQKEYFPKLTTELFGESISPAIIPSNPLHDLSPTEWNLACAFPEDPFLQQHSEQLQAI